jgi:small subunit ribosomal protein S20
MAHSRSSKKRIRQNQTRRERNKVGLTALRTQIKKMRQALAAGDPARAQAEFQVTASKLDKAATKGLLHKNNASRRKSRLALQLAKVAPPTTA